jgi:hypothetical protein
MSMVRPYQQGGTMRPQTESLADLLERVLDKGIVIAGDVVVNVLDLELLTLKLRLLICSADTAQSLGIDWWKHDSFLSSHASPQVKGEDPRKEIEQLKRRIAQLEGRREPADEQGP